MISPSRMGHDNEIRPGLLSRATALIYRYLVLELLMLVTLAPTMIALVLLEADSSNIPLFALALIPVAPALSAGLYALRAWDIDPDLQPARHYLRGYRLNVMDVLRWWVPLLLLATVLGVSLTNLAAVPGGSLLRPVLAVISVLALVWGHHMLLITAVFAFRTRDAARIAVVEIGRRWKVSLGAISLALVALGLAYLTFDVVPALLASLFVGLVWNNGRSLVLDVTERFVSHD